MPSRRETIQMNPEEVRGYLSTNSRIILVTNGPDGLPHPVPMNYGLDEEGRILISSFRKSQKVRNLERDPRATLLVESGETYDDLKSVIAYADAEIIGDPEDVARLMTNIRAEGALTTSMTEGMSEQVRASIAKRVLLRFTSYRHVSWDHTKLDGYY
ncbi:MAG: pyridoxamine 5'-phosphate oxidase family protein [Novosphingobium sp.]|nr:pyridoxamine 5'-phosphate oxidase family protein [Novosphingobium sp.]